MGAGDFAGALAGEDEVQIDVVKSGEGKGRSIPVWFTVEGTRMHLLPMYGLRTIWFRDLEKSGSVEVRAKNETRRVTPRVVRDPATVEEVKKCFRRKYGEADVKRYYPTTEVALEISL